MDFLGQINYKDDVPVLNRFSIERIANKVLLEMRASSFEKIAPIEIEKIIEHDFSITVLSAVLALDGSILGQMYFENMVDEVYLGEGKNLQAIKLPIRKQTVIFDSDLYNYQMERLRFTAAHELGHWILHQRYYSSVESKAARSRSTNNSFNLGIIPKSSQGWTEWQANQFAACILLPRDLVRIVIKEFLHDHQLSYRKMLEFSDQKMRAAFIDLCYVVANSFGVSRDCARIRLEKLFCVKYPLN